VARIKDMATIVAKSGVETGKVRLVRLRQVILRVCRLLFRVMRSLQEFGVLVVLSGSRSLAR